MHVSTTPRAPELQPIVDRYLVAWAARDVAAITALHTPDTRFVLHHGADPVEGRAAVAAAFAGLFERLPDLTAHVNRVHLGPGHWVLDWRLSYLVDESTGRRDGWDCLDLVTVSDEGLVATKDTFIDGARATAVLAAAPR